MPVAEAGAVPSDGVFITGATGFVGGVVLRRLLREHPDVRIWALARASDDQETRARGVKVISRLFPRRDPAGADAAERVTWVRGDVQEPRLGLSEKRFRRLAGYLGSVIHAAAATEFDLPYDQAYRANVDGTRHVLELAVLAGEGGTRTRYLHVSTAYVAGRRSGRVNASDLSGPDGPFNNSYEATKAEAERLVRSAMASLDATVVRPSIVVGDSLTGETSNFNVLYFPIKLAWRGALPLIPALPNTTLDVVPVDYVAGAIVALLFNHETAGKTYHLTAAADAMPLDAMIEHLFRIYDRERQAVGLADLPRTRRVGPWRWALIRAWLKLRLRGSARAAFEAFSIYEPYLLNEKFFEDMDTVFALRGTGVARPRWDDYFERIVSYAVASNWGRREIEPPSSDGLSESWRRRLSRSVRASGIRIMGASGLLDSAHLRSLGGPLSSDQVKEPKEPKERSRGFKPAISAELRFLATMSAEARRKQRRLTASESAGGESSRA